MRSPCAEIGKLKQDRYNFTGDSMAPFVQEKIKDIRVLCICFHVHRLDLFGSAAVDSHKPKDLDFLVEFKKPLPSGELANSYFGLLEALEKLFKCPIDLIEDSAIKNPYLREGVDETRKPIYAA